MKKAKPQINPDELNNPLDYRGFRQQMEGIIEAGVDHDIGYSQPLVDYTDLNDKRMSRHERRLSRQPIQAEGLSEGQSSTWIVITEGWCGDAAHALPVISHLAEKSDGINLIIVNRDQNLELMDRFLTDGSRSIPKLISLNENGEVEWTWGPRPKTLQDQFIEARSRSEFNKAEFQVHMQSWYNKDKGQTTAGEIIELVFNKL